MQAELSLGALDKVVGGVADGPRTEDEAPGISMGRQMVRAKA